MFDLVVQGTVICSDRMIDGGYVGTSGGKIAYVGESQPGQADQSIDATGNWNVGDSKCHRRTSALPQSKGA